MTALLRTEINTINYSEAVRWILGWARESSSRYVCAANAHMLMEAHDSMNFRQMVSGADLAVPDGVPLVWMLRWKGHRKQGRVYGPALMLQVLEQTAAENIPVGFYGGKHEVLNALVEKMQERFEGLPVVFSYSPPFLELSPSDDEEIVDQINISGARVLFVGLGCPRQELWMATHRGRVNAVMIGVGAAFDFHAGYIPQAPPWVQGLGMEWAFRFLMEPRRLWRRYLYHNPRFVFLALLDLLGWMKG